MMLEANIDDMNPEIYGYVMEKAFKLGALDVFMTPIIMKKNRPGIKLSVLCEQEKQEELEKLVLTETTTLGLRKYKVDRTILKRQSVKLKTKYGVVSMKLGYMGGKPVKLAPEFEECREIAEGFGIPIRQVYEDLVYAAKKYFEAIQEK